jgi:hypothetical protein
MRNSKILGRNLSFIKAFLDERHEGGFPREAFLKKRTEILQYMKNNFQEGKEVFFAYMRISSERGALLNTSIEKILGSDGIVILSEVYFPDPRPAYLSGDWGTPWLVPQCEAGYVLTTQEFSLWGNSCWITFKVFTSPKEESLVVGDIVRAVDDAPYKCVIKNMTRGKIVEILPNGMVKVEVLAHGTQPARVGKIYKVDPVCLCFVESAHSAAVAAANEALFNCSRAIEEEEAKDKVDGICRDCICW